MLIASLPKARADTQVGGPITSDTTWTLVNSPYIVVESIDVWDGVTLTIKPGVVVKFESEKTMQVNGELIAQGTASKPITFTSNQASPAPAGWGNIEFTSMAVPTTMDGAGNYVSGSVLQYCVVEYAGNSGDSALYAYSLLIDHCTVRYNGVQGIYDEGTETEPSRIANSIVIGNEPTRSGGSSLGGGIGAQHGTVMGNIVNGNGTTRFGLSGGGIWADYSTVTGNTVSGNHAEEEGGGIHAYYSTVVTNTIATNESSGGGAGAYIRDGYSSSCDFCYNTVVGNSGPAGSVHAGLEIWRSGLQVHYNSSYGNAPYDVTVIPSGDISGTLNYWGTVSSVDILDQVYDWHDDSSRGKFSYIPYLQDPDPTAPVSPPLGLVANWQDGSVVLHWDAIPSTAMGYGYKIYYDTDEPTPPYEGTGLDQGDSPIDVGNVTEYTLTGLQEGMTYYVAITAYDTLGREGWYSIAADNLSTLIHVVYLPLIVKED